MNLSEHFTLEELTISETAARRGIDNRPSPAIIANLRRLATALEVVRQLIGRRIIITSGYRSPALNDAIGGSRTSAHIEGLAADFISPPPEPLAICREIAASAMPFDQLIYEVDWVHFAIGPELRRQVLTFQDGRYSEGLI
jgi:zinc D-Ala-D-Ala carboxypeptidase